MQTRRQNKRHTKEKPLSNEKASAYPYTFLVNKVYFTKKKLKKEKLNTDFILTSYIFWVTG